MTIRIYVDWSGDPGFRFRRGSSELLIIAAMMADEEITVAPLRERLSMSDDFEFHFSKVDYRIRKEFCSYINAEIEIPGAVVLNVNKQLLPKDSRLKTGEQIIADFVALCVKGLPAHLLQNAILIYDGKKEQKSFRHILRKTLSDALKPDIYLGEVKAIPASQNDGLQIADMLAGLIRTDAKSVRIKNLKILEYPP
ncbi:MAG: DUF3800 domain-containing protein [Chloroflexota bacterium]